MTKETMFKDLLHNCSKSCTGNEERLQYARGIYAGFISTVIGFYHPLSVKSAMAYATLYLPNDFDKRCIPESWNES